MEPELSPMLVGAAAATGGAAAACAVGSSKNSSNQGNLLKGIDNKTVRKNGISIQLHMFSSQ